MTKRKKVIPSVEETLARPWCYYCERDFDDTAVLISHQKAKHFKCDRCNRRLNTIGGLSVHMNQVHKESLTTIENCLPNRNELDREIFAMEGIPDEIKKQHEQRVLANYYEAQAEHRKTTGNPVSGTPGAAAPKKAKVEDTSDIKKRLAEFKARKSQQNQTAAGGSDQTIPAADAGQNMQGVETHGVSPIPGQAFTGYSAPFNQPAPYPQPISPFGAAQGMPYAPPPSYPPHPGNSFQAPPPQRFGAGSPSQVGYGQMAPAPYNSQNGSSHPQSNLPPAPGLPQRPITNTPAVSHGQMAQLHQGYIPQSTSDSPTSNAPGVSEDPRIAHRASVSAKAQINNGDAVNKAPADVANTNSSEAATTDTGLALNANSTSKNSKTKKSERATRLIYSDNEVTPEEKKALIAKYSFNPAPQNSDLAKSFENADKMTSVA